MGRWKTEMGESLEVQKRASLVYTTEKQQGDLEEGEAQYQRLSSDLHTVPRRVIFTHECTHTDRGRGETQVTLCHPSFADPTVDHVISAARAK